MQDIIIAIDAGGTSIKVAAMNKSNVFLTDIYVYPALSNEKADKITKHFHTIIHEIYAKVDNENNRLVAISIGFPGPFDYEKGISYIKGIGKYDNLYSYHFKEQLCQLLQAFPTKNQLDKLPIVFENDATLFVLGEYYKHKNLPQLKLMGITLGTGCGSTFIIDGEIIASKYGIPGDGMIYHLPYKDSIIDDYISKRGILNIATKNGYTINNLEIVDIYNDALQGKQEALNTFYEFGDNLLESLHKIMLSFQPNIIVFGGQISKSFDFFGGRMKSYAMDNNIKLIINPDSSRSALIGANYYYTLKQQ